MDLFITSEPRDQAHVISIGGDLDVYTAPQLDRALADNGRNGLTLVLDLSRVHFIDSTALGVLVSALQRSRATDGDLLLVMDDPYLMKIFRITGFDSLFAIFPGIDQAVEAV